MTTIYELLVAFLWVLLALFFIVVLCYAVVTVVHFRKRRRPRYVDKLEVDDVIQQGVVVRKGD